MWVLRQYDRATDELVGEFRLPALRLEDAKDVLGFAPTQLGSTQLGSEQVEALAGRFGVAARDRDVESFLDFDAEPGPARRARTVAATP